MAGIEPLAGILSMKRWRLFAALAVILTARAVFAAETVDVTIDKGTLLRLDTNAKVVLVAEPGIADAKLPVAEDAPHRSANTSHPVSLGVAYPSDEFRY